MVCIEESGMLGIFRRKKTATTEDNLADQKDLAAGNLELNKSAHREQSDAPDVEVVEDNSQTETSFFDTEVENVSVEPSQKVSLYQRLKAGLKKTRQNFGEGLANLVLGKKKIDDELLEEIETQLLLADIGVEATTKISSTLAKAVSRNELADGAALMSSLKSQLLNILSPLEQPLFSGKASKTPQVILMVGINGAGKTTTIGKLAKKLSLEGKKVMLAAGDTFRAAAVEQLQVWGQRNDIPVIAQHTGADSASVIFDAFNAAKARDIDVLIADTAGRLHTQHGLMDELKKVKRVIQKLDESAPHEVMLVLDASIGQNALNQACQFNEAVGVTGLTMTKLDGTAKGGIVFAIADKLKIPFRYIGLGESIADLRQFKAKDFVDALFDDEVVNEESKQGMLEEA